MKPRPLIFPIRGQLEAVRSHYACKHCYCRVEGSQEVEVSVDSELKEGGT